MSPGVDGCASEDFEGVGLDDISQLAPSCFHSAVIIWSMQVLQFLGYFIAEGVGADDGGELVSPKRQAEAHQAIIETLRQTGQTSHDIVPDGKGNTSVASLCLWPAAPEEGVASTHLRQLTLLRESGFAESSNFHLVARPLPSD
ncbi:unnamed protein product [Schistocephalus solidus]|uniref:Uncharacterized protein n=1 Tax=Schistocephalus solidus TaxID=70667 RepID=A0A183TGB0_SCHSO|nr:unnamed protein product [Schistocephalus solidus]